MLAVARRAAASDSSVAQCVLGGAVVDVLEPVVTGRDSVVLDAADCATNAEAGAAANAASECAKRFGFVCDQPSVVAPAVAASLVDPAEDATPHVSCQRRVCPAYVVVNVPALPCVKTSTTHAFAVSVVIDVLTGFVLPGPPAALVACGACCATL